jgi:hypothetical protein
MNVMLSSDEGIYWPRANTYGGRNTSALLLEIKFVGDVYPFRANFLPPPPQQ